MPYNEESYENSLIELFQQLGYIHKYGPEVEHDYKSPLFDAEFE